MKIFDLHADLACAIQPKYEQGKRNILHDEWFDKFRKGEVAYTSAASFFRGVESWEDMQKTVSIVKEDLLASGAKIIYTKEDLDPDQQEPSFLMTIEGMCGIQDDVEEKIQWLYDQGNRIGSLEWNDENALATGNSGDPTRGLTELGKRAIKKMNELHFIVDVSHANEHTFWDILDASCLPIIATHSNAKRICFVERNLTDQQIRAIASKGGLIGMNACEAFISENKADQDAYHLAKHARYIADLVGHQYVACGFDYNDYYTDRAKHNLAGPDQTQNFITCLKQVGFNDEEIADIAWRNVYNFLQKYM